MDQRIIDLYDDYVHIHFDRRLFIDRAAKLLGTTTAAAALLPMFQSNYALAAMVAEDDPGMRIERITFPGATGEVKGYLAMPTGGPARRAGVVVVHQNRGLNAHIEDVARRLAKEGYTALGVDFVSPLGGTPPNEDAAMELLRQLDAGDRDANAVAAAAYLRGRADSNGKTGAIGFCWGGGAVNMLAVNDPQLNAAVPYYGNVPDADQVPKIEAALLLNYADVTLDTRLGGLLPGYEAALKANHKTYALHVYPGAQHAFNDDTNQERYHRQAAELAWSRTLAFFGEHLS